MCRTPAALSRRPPETPPLVAPAAGLAALHPEVSLSLADPTRRVNAGLAPLGRAETSRLASVGGRGFFARDGEYSLILVEEGFQLDGGPEQALR